MTQADTTRNEEMKRLRHVELWSLQQIADKYGISRERVRQLIGNTGEGYVTQRRKNLFEANKQKSNSFLRSLLGIGSVQNYRGNERHEIEGGYAKVGKDMEDYVSRVLAKNGIDHTLMGIHHAFDILLDNGLRVDVKSSSPLMLPRMKSAIYSFVHNRETRGDYADFFVCITRDTREIFVIPSCETRLSTPIRFCFPESEYGKKSKWLKYHNRFDLLKG